MGIGPIPRSKILDYGRGELELEGDELDLFVEIIREVDRQYTGMVNKFDRHEGKGETADIRDVAETKRVLGRLAARAAEAHRKDKAE